MPLVLALILLTAEPHSGLALERELSRPVSFDWPPRTLERALRELAETHRLNLVIGAKVDRSYQVYGKPNQLALDEVIDSFARLARARMVLVGDIVYLGSGDTADRLGMAAEAYRSAATRLSIDRRRQLERRRSLEWTGSERVVDLVDPIARELGLAIEGRERLVELPPANGVRHVRTADLLFVLFAECGRTWRIDEERRVLEAVELPAADAVRRTYRVPERTAQAAREYRDRLPDLKMSVREGRIEVAGPFSSIQRFERLRARQASSRAARKGLDRGKLSVAREPGEPRYSLQLTNVTLRTFAERLAEATGKEVVLDQDSLKEAGRSRLDRISCTAANLTLEELLSQVLPPAGLDYHIADQTVTITARPRSR